MLVHRHVGVLYCMMVRGVIYMIALVVHVHHLWVMHEVDYVNNICLLLCVVVHMEQEACVHEMVI